ncbi:MAG: DUF1822 family protein [Phormidesmis sp.]
MTVKRDHHTFKVPITDAFHRAAQEFYQCHSDPKKAKQIYLNTLSVQAVKFYLACLGIEADLESSESWHPVLQVLSAPSDLWVNDLGRLDCRPVLPESSTLEISSEMRSSDRIGYVFSRFDTTLAEATLLGFISKESLAKIEEAFIGLDQLQPLETFPDYLAGISQAATVALPLRVKLQPWLVQVVDAEWTSVNTLIEAWQNQNLALSFRTLSVKADWIKPARTGVKQGKFLHLDQVSKHRSEDQILLVVGIAPASRNGPAPANSAAADSTVFDITIEVYPAGEDVYLPPTLHMTVMDEANTPVLQAKGRQSEGLEFQFSGRSGEQFSVHIRCEQFNTTELFEI